jgi:hypothetical protein
MLPISASSCPSTSAWPRSRSSSAALGVAGAGWRSAPRVRPCRPTLHAPSPRCAQRRGRRAGAHQAGPGSALRCAAGVSRCSGGPARQPRSPAAPQPRSPAAPQPRSPAARNPQTRRPADPRAPPEGLHQRQRLGDLLLGKTSRGLAATGGAAAEPAAVGRLALQLLPQLLVAHLQHAPGCLQLQAGVLQFLRLRLQPAEQVVVRWWRG